jgi:DNA-binding transcriptional regulator YdaS (Cro superfamily)
MDKVTQLKRIKKVIQHGETGQLAELSGVHPSVVSQYLNHAGRIVLNRVRVDAILKAWGKIEDNKFRNY